MRLTDQNLWMMFPESVRIQGNAEGREVLLDESFLDPRYSQLIVNHSLDGFNWGYSGSGPSQLALAICLYYLPIRYATRLYQLLKNHFVANLPQGKDFDIVINLQELVKNILL